jgi:glutaredoxin 3
MPSAENLLNAREIPYAKIMITEGSAEHDQPAQRSGMRTLPQVFIGSLLVGGYQETLAADQAGMLADLLVG